jgi:copper homeostasis protein (lipoprotein)
MWYNTFKYGVVMLVVLCCSCNRDHKKSNTAQVFKGLYSFGPEAKSFKNCDDTQEYWVTDSSSQLELKYSQMNFEKPYEPVYVEVEGTKTASANEGVGSEYDSTLVVTKVLKITKEIPQDLCN